MDRINSAVLKLRIFISSSKFLYLVLALFLVESLWIAFSFRFPMIYDEGTHMGFIQMYSDSLLPYTTETPGNMTTQISLFHYLMSFPYRVLTGHVESSVIIILFRVVCIGLVAWGLLIYAKVLKTMRVPKSAIHISLLVFILLPIVPFVAATVNYDNLLFPLTALFMLYAARIIEDKVISLTNIALFIVIGSLAALTKYSFLPIFVAGFLFVTAVIVYKNRNAVKQNTIKAYRRLNKNQKIIYGLSVVVAMSFMLAVYGVNVVKYHAITPSCFALQPKDVCMRNGIIKRTINAKQTLEERRVVPPTNYIYSIWFTNMLKTTNWSGNYTVNKKFVFASPLPVVDTALFAGVILSIAVTLLMWRSLPLTTSAKFGVLMCIILAMSVLLLNIRGYYAVHAANANQPRYLLSLLPIFLAISVWSMSELLKKHQLIKVGILVFALLFATQGAGSITHIVRSDTSWYWPNDQLIIINQKIKTVFSKAVIESYRL